MMSRAVDYYAVLGVSPDATAEEIKRRYRQLVRAHHPDVADDPETSQERFVRVVEAYRVLSDPIRRRTYDALQAVAPPPVTTRSAQVEEQLENWFRHAVHRLEAGDLTGAAAQCLKILGLEPQHAAAQAMLGDICAARAEWDQALVHYSGAVAASPRNLTYARKLRDAAENGQRIRAANERRAAAEAQRRRALAELNYRHELGPYLALLSACWVAVLLVWMVREAGPPLPWPPLPAAVLLAAAGSGLAVGLGLTVSRVGSLSPQLEEAVVERWLSLAIGLVALGQCYLAVAAYAVIALLRERLTPALNAALAGTTGLLLVLLAVLRWATPGGPALVVPAALWAGNVLLPATLLGQALGRAGLQPVGDGIPASGARDATSADRESDLGASGV